MAFWWSNLSRSFAFVSQTPLCNAESAFGLGFSDKYGHLNMQGVFLKSPHISSGWPRKRRSAALHHNYYQILGLVPAAALESAIFLSQASYEQVSCSDRPQCHASSPNTHPALGKHTLQASGLSSLFFTPSPHLISCVCECDSPEMERISLSQCKKKVPSFQHAHFQWHDRC